MEFSPIVRQIFVAIAPQLAAFSLGGSLGYPCVLLEQFKNNESSIRPDLGTMTWIASMHGFAGIGAILMPAIMQLKGRKLAFIGSCLLLLIGWILVLAARDAYMVLLAEVFLGLGANCTVIVNLIFVSEIVAPKFRTASMMLIEISQSIGFITVTSLGTVILVHWKHVALIISAPLAIALLMITLWPESPSWLAYKGKLVECEKAFKWLRGTNDESNKELRELMLSQKENDRKVAKKSNYHEICSNIKRKDFYKPCLHFMLVLFNFYITGAVCLAIYGKDVMTMATGSKNAANIGLLSMDVIVLIGGIFSLIYIRYFKSKTIIYIGATANLFLLSCSLVSYLQHSGVISSESYMFIYFYLGYVAFCSSGLASITFTIAVELIPVKHRGLGGALFNITTSSLHFTTVKLLPYLILWINIWGTFVFFASASLTCTLLIWKLVPDTKGRTLKEVEDYYNFGSFVKRFDVEGDADVIKPIVKSNI